MSQQKQFLQEISPCYQQCTSPSSGHFINQHVMIVDKEREDDQSSEQGNKLDNDYNFDSDIQLYQQQQWRDEDIEDQSACPPNEWGNEGYILSSRYKQEAKTDIFQNVQPKVISNSFKKVAYAKNINAVPVWQKQMPMQTNLNKAKLHQVLHSSDLMDDYEVEEAINCVRCQVSNNYFFEATQIERRLYSKYASSQNYYYSRDVNDILMGGRTQAVIQFKDSTVIDEQSEYLKRFYQASEFNNKITLLTEYYKFHRDIPRLFMMPETIVLDNYHYKKRRWEDKRIAQMIEEENNKLNPNINQDVEFYKKNAVVQKVEVIDQQEELFLEEISSFINRNQNKSRNIQENTIKKTKTEITLLEELNGKLEEIVNNSSRSQSLIGSSVLGRAGENEGLKPFDNAQLDNFLSFLNQQNSRGATNNHGIQSSVYQKPLLLADVASRNQSISQLEPGHNHQKIQNLQNKNHTNNNDSKQSLKQHVSQSIQEIKQSLSIQSDQMTKRNHPQLILDDMDNYAEPILKKNQNNILELDGVVPYGLSAFSTKSAQKFSVGIQQNLLSVRSAREQYQISQNNHLQPINQLPSSVSAKTTGAKGGNFANIKTKDIPISSNSVQVQQFVSSLQTSKQNNLQNQPSACQLQQQQNTNSVASSNSLVVKLDTKDSQLYTPRSPVIPMSSQHSILSKNLLQAVKSQQNILIVPQTKPPISPRDSLLPSPKQSSIQNTQLHQNYFSSENSKEKLENKQSNQLKNQQLNKNPSIQQIPAHTHGNESNYLAAIALSKSGWRQLNLKLKLDHLNASKEKPAQNNKSISNALNNHNNNNNNLNEAQLKNTVNSSNIGAATKDQISQRSCSSKNLDQLTPKYNNFYEIFKQQIANHQGSPINWMKTAKSKNSTALTTTNQPQNNALHMLQLISAQQQQALQKSSAQQMNLSSSQQQSETLNKPAIVQQGAQCQTKLSTGSVVSSSQHQKTFSQPKPTVSNLSSNQKQPYKQQQSQQQPYLLSPEMKINQFLSTQRKNQTGTAISTGNTPQQVNLISPKSNPLEQQIKLTSQQHTSQNDSKILSNSQTKQTFDKQPSSSATSEKVIKSHDQSHNPSNPIISSPATISFQSKQPSRNSSLETNGNSNILSKKSSQLFPNPKREIKSVYNHVQQLANDGISAKQSISARNYQQNGFVGQPNQLDVADSQQNSLPLFGTNFSLAATANSGSMALYGYHQSKVSLQSSEYDNRDSAPSTTGGGKSNNTSSQQHSSCGANSTQNFKNQATNGSTFSTVSASIINNNNNTINSSTINNIQSAVFVQNQLKTVPQSSKNSSQSTIPFFQQSQQHQNIQQATKEGPSQVQPTQSSKKNNTNHKHTKSENSINNLENTHGFIGLNHQKTIPGTSPKFSSFIINGNNNNNNNNQNKSLKIQSNQLPQQPQQQEQYIQKLLFLSSKKNSSVDPSCFSSLTVPSSCRNQSSVAIHTQPMSPRLIPNPLTLLQGKQSERQISVNQLPQYLSKKQPTASPATNKQTKGISKSNCQLQVQIMPNHSFQATIPSATAMSPLSSYGTQERCSISGIPKNAQIINQTSSNQISASQFKQINSNNNISSSCNNNNNNNNIGNNNNNNLSNQGFLKVQFEVGKKSKKKSMY